MTFQMQPSEEKEEKQEKQKKICFYLHKSGKLISYSRRFLLKFSLLLFPSKTHCRMHRHTTTFRLLQSFSFNANAHCLFSRVVFRFSFLLRRMMEPSPWSDMRPPQFNPPLDTKPPYCVFKTAKRSEEGERKVKRSERIYFSCQKTWAVVRAYTSYAVHDQRLLSVTNLIASLIICYVFFFFFLFVYRWRVM